MARLGDPPAGGQPRWFRIGALVRQEFRSRGGDARFLMWISFLLGFVWVRAWWLLSQATTTQVTVSDEFKLGSPAVIGGYHPHHIAAGVFMLAVAGWLGIHYAGPRVTRFMAVLYGVGLGFVVDEVGFIVEGVGRYYGYHLEVFTLVVLIGAVMMTSVYFPAFWNKHFPRVWHRFEQRALRVLRRFHRPAPASRTVVVSPLQDGMPASAPDDAAGPRP